MSAIECSLKCQTVYTGYTHKAFQSNIDKEKIDVCIDGIVLVSSVIYEIPFSLLLFSTIFVGAESDKSGRRRKYFLRF